MPMIDFDVKIKTTKVPISFCIKKWEPGDSFVAIPNEYVLHKRQNTDFRRANQSKFVNLRLLQCKIHVFLPHV